MAGWSHDGAQATLGFEKQGRIGWAILSVSGRVSDHVRYYVSVNPVSETTSRPACGEKDYFFPNDPNLYAAQGPIVKCDEEDGLKRVDTYNTFSLDYITQQGILREGYVDWGMSDTFSLRGGRFILPIGLAPRDVGATSAKDMTRITRLNAEANFGVMFAASARKATRSVFDAGVMVILGDGNREKDYDWFYFVNRTLDTNSAVTVAASARVQPIEQIDLRVAYKHGYTGSKVERLPSYWASKRNDDALVVSVKVSPVKWASVFAEYAKYKWGPTITSGELVGVPTVGPIEKPGYYMGAQLDVPVTGKRPCRRQHHARGADARRQPGAVSVSEQPVRRLDGQEGPQPDRARLHRRQPPRQRQFLLGGRLESVPVGERQLAGVGSDGVYRSRAGSPGRHRHGPHAVSPAFLDARFAGIMSRSSGGHSMTRVLTALALTAGLLSPVAAAAQAPSLKNPASLNETGARDL